MDAQSTNVLEFEYRYIGQTSAGKCRKNEITLARSNKKIQCLLQQPVDQEKANRLEVIPLLVRIRHAQILNQVETVQEQEQTDAVDGNHALLVP